ncbi:MAG: hypothetical protein L6420_01810 [Elusimicrobia bacterium]|nr:hypothetical protein [Elusimicrobiota bacterium]
MKSLLFLISMTVASSFVFANEEIEYLIIRQLMSPEFNLTEINEETITGTFKDMSVHLVKSGEKENATYNGWVVKGKEKLPVSIFYKDKKMHGDFNGNKFTYVSMDIKKQLYTFKTDKGEAIVSYLYESKKGRHQINPLFIVKNNGRNYLVRLEGECCVGYGLYYSAVLYGLTTFDKVEKRVEGSGVRVEE